MAQLGRPGLSAPEKVELWKRWINGESLSDIGRALEKHAGSIFTVLKSNGGVFPRFRRRSHRAITFVDREEISRGIVAGRSIRQIAAGIDRSPSTISREISRHGGRKRYRAIDAETNAWNRARRPKSCLLAQNGRLRRIVALKLSLEWSPE